MARFAVLGSIILSNIGIALIAVCIATDSWVSRKRPTFEAKEGLFYRCVKNTHANGEVHSKCDRIYANFKDFPALYIAILSLMFGACLIQLINFLVSLCSACMDSPPTKTICTLIVLSAMCAVGGLSAYVRFYDNKYYRFDWSYIIGWVGVCFMAVGLVFIIVGIEKKEQNHY